MADSDDDIAIIVPFTTNDQALNFPNTVDVEPSDQNGLDERSVALVFQLRAIDEKRIQRKIGSLEGSHLETIEEKTREMLQI